MSKLSVGMCTTNMYLHLGLRMTEVKTQFNTEIEKKKKKKKKNCFQTAPILLLIGKIIIT